MNDVGAHASNQIRKNRKNEKSARRNIGVKNRVRSFNSPKARTIYVLLLSTEIRQNKTPLCVCCCVAYRRIPEMTAQRCAATSSDPLKLVDNLLL